MRIRPIVACAALYVAGITGDWITSAIGQRAGDIFESNPFYRDLAYKWDWHKALVGDSVQMLLLACLAFCLWKVGELVKKNLGEALASLPFLYFGFNRLWDADYNNLLFCLHFYVAAPHQ